MPNDPPNKAERALEALRKARSRTTPPSFPIPPASKLAWEKEIRQIYGRGEAPSRPHWAVWWPRFALLGGCALLIFFSLRIKQPDQEQQLALNTPTAETENSLVTRGMARKDEQPRPAAAPAAPMSAAVSERRLAAKPPALLQHFTVEQRGNALRVVDEDGSIYAGSVEPDAGEPIPAPAKAVEATRAAGQVQTSLDRRKPAAQGPQLQGGTPPTLATTPEPKKTLLQASIEPSSTRFYSFKANGTNRNTGESVALEGQLVLPPGLAQSTNTFVMQATNITTAPGGPSQTLVLFQGTAQVGAQLKRKVQAVSPSR